MGWAGGAKVGEDCLEAAQKDFLGVVEIFYISNGILCQNSPNRTFKICILYSVRFALIKKMLM